MRTDINLHIETPDIIIDVTYECLLSRFENGDGMRTWWDPEIESTLIHALVTNMNDQEWEWRYGETMPNEITDTLDRFADRINDMLYDKAKDIISTRYHKDRDHD